MIVDSPYVSGEAVLTPVGGAAAGMVASLVMLAVASLVRPLGAVLVAVGGAVWPAAWMQAGWQADLLGLGAQVIAGALLGLLYASSQRGAPPAAMLVTGVIYGVMIWVGARIVTSFAFESLRDLVHSWSWFLSCLAYGAAVAAAGVLRQRFRPAVAPTVLRD